MKRVVPKCCKSEYDDENDNGQDEQQCVGKERVTLQETSERVVLSHDNDDREK